MKRLLCAALLVSLLFLFAPAALAAECAPGQHNYVESGRIPATAMEDGEIEYVCTTCGHSYTKVIFATDHLWGEWITDRAPTCTEPGERHRTCTRGQLHNQYAAIPALGHDYKETRTEPTCLKPGKSVFVCANDPTHTYEKAIPAPGSHSFSEWQIERPAGEGTEGLEARTCTRCGFKENRVLAARPIPKITIPTTEPSTTEPTTEPITEAPSVPTTTMPAAEPSTELSRTFPIVDVVLIGASSVSFGYFTFLLIPYFLGLAFANRRRKAIALRDELRKEVDARFGYK